MLKFSTVIPREHLRPNYADGFAGAPLTSFRPSASKAGQHKGGMSEESKTKKGHRT
jgi:hypothetical protein